MPGNDSSDDDLVMGRANHAQDPTRLHANNDEHAWGDDVGDQRGPVLDIDAGNTMAANAILATANHVNNGAGGTGGVAIVALGYLTGVMASVGTTQGGTAIHGSGGRDNTGVKGYGDPGVMGEPATDGEVGVWGRSLQSGDGVLGESDSGIGVHGTSTSGSGVHGSSVAGNGLVGESGTADGLVAHSEHGRGARFSTLRNAQMQLTPFFDVDQVGLPCDAQAGDVLMYSPQPGPGEPDPTEQGNLSLWLCIRSNDPERPAMWARVQHDIVIRCGEIPPPPPKRPERIDG